MTRSQRAGAGGSPVRWMPLQWAREKLCELVVALTGSPPLKGQGIEEKSSVPVMRWLRLGGLNKGISS